VRNISEFPSPKERGENVLGIQKYFEYVFFEIEISEQTNINCFSFI
jgi:hypothetical protein